MRLEETPTDILTSTARSFAEDDFYDRYGTSGRMTSAKISASNLRKSGEQACSPLFRKLLALIFALVILPLVPYLS